MSEAAPYGAAVEQFGNMAIKAAALGITTVTKSSVFVIKQGAVGGLKTVQALRKRHQLRNRPRMTPEPEGLFGKTLAAAGPNLNKPQIPGVGGQAGAAGRRPRVQVRPVTPAQLANPAPIHVVVNVNAANTATKVTATMSSPGYVQAVNTGQAARGGQAAGQAMPVAAAGRHQLRNQRAAQYRQRQQAIGGGP